MINIRHISANSGCSVPKILMAGDFKVKAGWTLGPRKLGEYELVYFPVGTRTEYRLADRVYLLHEPSFVLTRPAEEHTYIFDSSLSTRHLFIHFVIDPLSGIYDLSSVVSPSSPCLFPAGQVSLLPALFKHILYLAAIKSVHWEERCNLMLYTLLAELDGLSELTEPHTLTPFGPNLPPQISRALQYIDMNLHLSLSIAEIAENAGWTHEYFTRTFVRHLGVSPQHAICGRRIERACQLLIQTKATVKQIAFAVGFHDEHYFSRCFSKWKGMTATEYRKQFSDPRSRHLSPAEEFMAPYPLNRYFVFSNEN
ncbi:AraC family transcriptional regulator [Paenibacillus filicis]|uniref:AraC family transcriptional regulator n=1 Tax=Paenibacillus gyeongsangnamensis TaxID=3388067 RepID=A0ABT4QER9_9BACL|nr:helix-turn-helix domain-containing protein [Paenibacillus filicis]MCZ8515339.1 AraC family transcriptional regulator [Paenibacillus filicis]